MLEVLYHRAEFGGARISPATGVAKTLSVFDCLFVRLFVRQLLNVRDCAPDFAVTALEFRNNIDVVG